MPLDINVRAVPHLKAFNSGKRYIWYGKGLVAFKEPKFLSEMLTTHVNMYVNLKSDLKLFYCKIIDISLCKYKMLNKLT